MNDDPFDLAKLKLTAEQITELAPFQKKSKSKPRLPRSRRQAGTTFIKLPYERALAAAGRLGNAPMAVLIEIGYLAFKAHGKLVPLANKALRAAGVTRWAKLRALRQLEAAGFVTVVWRAGGKSPLVSLRWE
jgi:hypothetical protein